MPATGLPGAAHRARKMPEAPAGLQPRTAAPTAVARVVQRRVAPDQSGGTGRAADLSLRSAGDGCPPLTSAKQRWWSCAFESARPVQEVPRTRCSRCKEGVAGRKLHRFDRPIPGARRTRTAPSFSVSVSGGFHGHNSALFGLSQQAEEAAPRALAHLLQHALPSSGRIRTTESRTAG